MSRKYQYFAEKRGSSNYRDAQSICKSTGNFTRCKVCLRRAGLTRQLQKEHYYLNNICHL